MNSHDYGNARMEAGEQHVLSIVSSFLGPEIYAECSCGWRSDDLLSQTAAQMIGEGHVREVALSGTDRS